MKSERTAKELLEWMKNEWGTREEADAEEFAAFLGVELAPEPGPLPDFWGRRLEDRDGNGCLWTADLVRMQAPLPANPEDHKQKTYSAGVVAHAMERHEDALKDLAVRVRKVADKLPAAQPPANGEPAAGADLLEAPCAWCGHNGPGYWQSGSHPASCPWHTVGGKVDRAHLLRWIAPASSPPELPTDWREAVEGALAEPLACYRDSVGSKTYCPGRDHQRNCPARLLPAVTSATLSALTPLVLAEKLRAERLRRGLERLLDHTWSDSMGGSVACACPNRNQHFDDCPFAALAADPPDAALAELLGLPGRMRGAANQAAASKFPAAAAAVAGALDAWADNLDAVLAKLGLPAGEGAGDG